MRSVWANAHQGPRVKNTYSHCMTGYMGAISSLSINETLAKQNGSIQGSNFTSPLEKWQRLGDGYRVEARFVLWQQDDVLQVPASGLFRVNGGWAVFGDDAGRARCRLIDVGQCNGLVAGVVAGLEEGELIINHPSDAIAEGSRFKKIIKILYQFYCVKIPLRKVFYC